MWYGTINRSEVVDTNGDDSPAQEKPNPSRLCLRIASGLAVFIVLVVILMTNLNLRKTIPSLDSPLVASKIGPGIGIDLTPSYGTVAIRYDNGSTINIAKIDADVDYQRMMKRLSIGGKHFDSMWQDYCGRMFDYSWPRILRMLREALGLPSTQDVARLSRLIAMLQSVAEEHTTQRIPAAVISTPSFPAVCIDDVVEAAGYNGILTLRDKRRPLPQPRELNAAFFGAGFGHCSNFSNPDLCNAEEEAFPVLEFLYVSFSNATLFLRRQSMEEAHDTALFEDDLLVDYELGSNAIPGETEAAQAYWLRISDRVLELCRRQFWPQYPLEKVLLFGESAGHPSLLKTLKSTIPQLQDSMPDFVLQDPVYIAARGAAQFAKRAREDWATIA